MRRAKAKVDSCAAPFLGAALSTVSGAAVLLWCAPAMAEPSSWLFAGGAIQYDEPNAQQTTAVAVETGLGLPADGSLVWGVLGRGHILFGDGVDLAVLSRFVSGSYARGGFGFGLDVGAMRRWWGERTTAATANLVLGAPWGLSARVGGNLGTNEHQEVFVSVGIDFARLTVHRHSGLDWMPNPLPSPPVTEDDGTFASSTAPLN